MSVVRGREGTEVGGRMSEVRGRRAEGKGRRSGKDRDQGSECGGQRLNDRIKFRGIALLKWSSFETNNST